jgi:inhibitor of cysteine peptidase
MSAKKSLVLSVVLVIAACKSSPEPTTVESAVPTASNNQPPITQTSTAPSSITSGVPTYGEGTHEFSTAVGQAFTLSLPANITTPYKWVVNSSVDPTAFELVKDEYVANPPDGCLGCVGMGGRRLMTFQAKRVGLLTLSLRYQSITDAKAEPASEYQANIQVK